MDNKNTSRIATIRFSAIEADFLLRLAEQQGISFGQAARESVLQNIKFSAETERLSSMEARLLDAIKASVATIIEIVPLRVAELVEVV